MTQIAPVQESPVRKLVRMLGILMILSGLTIMGWFAWQYWGTNVVAHKHQQQILDKWVETDAVGILRVPRFGADYQVPILPGGDLVGPKGADALSRGVAWYEPGAKPGAIGNFVIAGHRVTHGEPFANFPKLKAGDKVSVETRNAWYTYVLRSGGTEIVVPFTASWPLQDVPDPNPPGGPPLEPTKAVLTMVTCSELFHTDNRSVVIGDLASTKVK
ncbi:MAG: sortase domain-bontaining protein [Aeromicrobium sp.]